MFSMNDDVFLFDIWWLENTLPRLVKGVVWALLNVMVSICKMFRKGAIFCPARESAGQFPDHAFQGLCCFIKIQPLLSNGWHLWHGGNGDKQKDIIATGNWEGCLADAVYDYD